MIAADWSTRAGQQRSNHDAQATLLEEPSLPIDWPAATSLPPGDQQGLLYFDSPAPPSILHVQLFDSVHPVTGEPVAEPIHEILCEMKGFEVPPSCPFSGYQNGTSSVQISVPPLDQNLYAVVFGIWTVDPTAMEEDSTASYLMQFQPG
ncbi:MAG TPA: hypothetical protein VEW93_11315 [Acidimicrobiales bacterium]|nr:hypothetical protein [Acidimicrobiales bacterium]